MDGVFAANANDTAGPVTYSIAFSDSAGNAGTAVTSTSDGTAVGIVIDTGSPTLLSSTPSDNSAGAKLDQNIVLTFSEDVIAGSGDIELFERSGNTLVESFTVSSSMISGATVTLNPAADFKPNARLIIFKFLRRRLWMRRVIIMRVLPIRQPLILRRANELPRKLLRK